MVLSFFMYGFLPVFLSGDNFQRIGGLGILCCLCFLLKKAYEYTRMPVIQISNNEVRISRFLAKDRYIEVSSSTVNIGTDFVEFSDENGLTHFSKNFLNYKWWDEFCEELNGMNFKKKNN